MIVTAISQLTGIKHSMDIPGITEERLARCWRFSPVREGKHIQEEFPELSADQREFLITGITAEEWATLGGSDD